MKIIQILVAPENSKYQGVILGLGTDGFVYYYENNKWRHW